VGTFTLTVTVEGCDNTLPELLLSGVTVTLLLGGSTIGTCTTSSLGQCVFTALSSGTYTVQVTGLPTGYASFTSASVSVTANTNYTAQCTPDSTHICCGVCPGLPIPKTLTFNDSIGDLTATWQSSLLGGGVMCWAGTQNYTISTCTYDSTCTTFSAPSSQTIPIHYELYCHHDVVSGLYSFQMDAGFWPTCPSLGCYVPGGGGSSALFIQGPFSPASVSCSPFCAQGFTVNPLGPLYTVSVRDPAVSFSSCNNPAQLTVNVQGCNALNLSGATVTASLTGQPNVVGTTDGGGNATLLLPATGTWTITTTSSRFGTDTSSKTVTGNGQILTLAVVLTPTSSYVCVSGCAQPLSKTLKLTDPNNTITPLTLTYDAVSTTWIGCYVKSAVVCQQNVGLGCNGAIGGCAVAYSYNTAGFLTAYYNACDGAGVPTPTNCPRGAGFTNEFTGFPSSVTSHCPTAFAYSAHLELPSTTGILVNGTVSISE